MSPEIEYFTPKTIEEACSLALTYQGKAKIIAGGTDLIVQVKHKEVSPSYIINIKDTGLDYITPDEQGGLRIGALATHRSIEASPLIKEGFAILAQAAAKLGTWQIRNRSTIGGNLVTAATSADTIPALMVLEAKLKIMGADGERLIPIGDFFTGPGQTLLRPDEIVSEIQVPGLPRRSGGVYIKHTIRKSLDLAIIGVAAIVTLDGDTLADVRIALGTAAPTPMRARKAEAVLRGKPISDDLLQQAGQAALDESSPRDSLRASADYRRKMIKVLVTRAIKQAVEQVKTG